MRTFAPKCYAYVHTEGKLDGHFNFSLALSRVGTAVLIFRWLFPASG